MALSDWDTLCVDLEGNPNPGYLKTPQGVEVKLHKNWIYLFDMAALTDPRDIESKRSVAHIDSGRLQYKDVFIEAIRGPQNGIFMVSYYYGKDYKDIIGIAGCSVSGYEGNSYNYVGVNQESFDFLKDFVSGKTYSSLDEVIEDMSDLREHFESEEKFLESCRTSLEDTYHFADPIRSIDFSRAVRYCQGDMYFSDAIGPEKVGGIATKVGDANPTMMQRMIGSSGESNSKDQSEN